jgi:hypothetical protein
MTMDHLLAASGQYLDAYRDEVALIQAMIELGYLAADQFGDWMKP